MKFFWIIACFFLFSQFSLAEGTGAKLFRDEKNGFEFSYLQDFSFECLCKPEEGLAYGDLTSRTGEHVASINLKDSGDDEDLDLKEYEYFKEKTFENFALYQAQLSCVAVGPVSIHYCDHAVQQKSFMNRYGMKGVELYLRAVREPAGAQAEYRAVGPIYAIFLRKPEWETRKSYLLLSAGRLIEKSLKDTFRIFLVIPDFDRELTPFEATSLQQIADSVREIHAD